MFLVCGKSELCYALSTMLVMTKKGLYCRAGDFYIDPSGAVDRAVVTHAHSDHARKGGKTYYSTTSGADLLRVRLGAKINVQSFLFGESFHLGPVKLSFHPAGHILGSAQVRLEYAGEVWVVSGDYKRDPDPTCEPFETVTCDVFVTEATFGTPGFRWPKTTDQAREIHSWWMENSKRGVNSVLFAYSLGKTQRILGLLEPLAERPIYCHAAAKGLNECYQKQGIRLAKVRYLDELEENRVLRGDLILAPPAFLRTEAASVLGSSYETAFASGWTAQRDGGVDRGFTLSDHADWDDLVRTVTESGAKRVYVQHRGHGALVKHLRTLGLHAFPDSDLQPQDPAQLAFF